IILLCIIIFGAVGVYGFLSTNIIFRSLGKVIPYPIVIVGAGVVTYTDYADSVTSLEKFFKSQEETAYGGDDIRDRVLERLVTNRILEGMAQKRDIKVFDYEIEREFQQAIIDFGTEDDIKENIEELYGWTIDEYKKNIVGPFVLEKKIIQAIFDDEPGANEKFSQYLQEERGTIRVIYLIRH
ncbi:SurA N-terminal domain-containing protein, partial [Patescibacteria group bacterium]|nr:SurA N-terminal domain-containing protein [Patescibacteria group bacterium]